MIDVEALFEKFGSNGECEFLKFERVIEPLSKRPDLCAFLLLDRLVPDTRDIVSAAEHDEIFLNVDVNELALVATDGDILTLVRCGVMFNDGSLSMFA